MLPKNPMIVEIHKNGFQIVQYVGPSSHWVINLDDKVGAHVLVERIESIFELPVENKDCLRAFMR